MAKQPPQESHLPEHDATKLELVVTINETDNGTALDSQLRREQAEAFVELIAAHLSRVRSVPPPSDKERPCE